MGIVGALGLGGYQLLADIAGVGAAGSVAGVPARGARARSLGARRRHPDLAAPTATEGRGRGGGLHPASRAARLHAAVGLPARRSSATACGARSTSSTRHRGDRGPDSRQGPGTPVGGGMNASRLLGASRRSRQPGSRRILRSRSCCAKRCSRWRCRDETIKRRRGGGGRRSRAGAGAGGQRARSAGGAGGGQGASALERHLAAERSAMGGSVPSERRGDRQLDRPVREPAHAQPRAADDGDPVRRRHRAHTRGGACVRL